MRVATFLAGALLGASLSASADVSLNIGLNLGAYPELVAVPDYPVYYAPRVSSNLFFYDGLYWVFAEDRWYSSSWYNGPWGAVERDDVPMYVLRVPVRYYRRPPAYFDGWGRDAPPRWGTHWGLGWERNHRSWDHWDRASAPRPAPLPSYQRNYAGNRYPGAEQQRTIRDNNYHYAPHESGRAERGPQQNTRPVAEPRFSRDVQPDRPATRTDTRRPTQGPTGDHAPDRGRPADAQPERRSGPSPGRSERSRAAPTPDPQGQRSRQIASPPHTPAQPAERAARRNPPPDAQQRPATPTAEPRTERYARGSQREPPPPHAREQTGNGSNRDEKGHDERRGTERGARAADSPPHSP